MNNKANYKKGHRRDITELLLQTGTIPLRTVMLTKDNSKGFRQQVYIMIKDGSLKTTGRGQEKVVTLSRYEDVKTDYISKELFDSCIRTGYLTEITETVKMAVNA